MAMIVYTFVLAAFSAVFASDVPVLMWSPERPLKDLPPVPASDKISQDTFHSDYLARLLSKKSNVIVAFLQDKLNINDISKYADVYNANSDGGAFKNIKGLLDEHFSLELPRVRGSHLALDSLRRNFPGHVHDLTSASDLSDLDLGGQENHLVIVRLLSVSGADNAENVFASNDETIGEVSKQLQKKNVRYTALYTAKTSLEREKRDIHQTRQLMAVGADKGYLFNKTEGNYTVYLYLTSMDVCVAEKPKEGPPTTCNHNFTLDVDTLKEGTFELLPVVNRTLSVKLAVSNVKPNGSAEAYNMTLVLPFKHQFDRWELMDAELTVEGSSPLVSNESLTTRGYDPVVSLLYSFHCSNMLWVPKNLSDPMQAYVTIHGFQVQPFNVQQGGGFLLSQDCVGWFSIGIWMSLVPTGLCLVILFFGMYMILSLSTNDRFDDPKGKTLIINAGE